MNLFLKEPTINEKEEVIAMCKELEMTSADDKYEGAGSLSKVLTDSYEKWLELCELDKHIEDIKPEWSNATNYLLVDESGKVYGFCSLRHHLKGELINIGGNIGYSIRPTERGRGYGKLQLKLALIEAEKLGIEKALVTCRENNIGSKKTIESCLGVADTPVPSRTEGIMELRYWIDTKTFINEVEKEKSKLI